MSIFDGVYNNNAQTHSIHHKQCLRYISLVRYSKEKGVDLVVLGSRGLGAFKRSLMSAVGLGSVSDYCTHHLQCAVAVVKFKDDHKVGTEAAHREPTTGAALDGAGTSEQQQEEQPVSSAAATTVLQQVS